MIVCCVHCYAVRLIIAFVDVNKTYLILSYVAPSTESHCSNEVIDANDARHRSQLEKLFAKTMNDSELSRYSVKFLYLLKLYRTSAH